jgi:hypothetical protein
MDAILPVSEEYDIGNLRGFDGVHSILGNLL